MNTPRGSIKHPAHLTTQEEAFMHSVRKSCMFLWDDFVKHRSASQSSIMFLRNNTDLIGWGFLYKIDDFYFQMYLMEGFRGKGFGKTLVELAELTIAGSDKALIQAPYSVDVVRRLAGEELVDYSDLGDDEKE